MKQKSPALEAGCWAASVDGRCLRPWPPICGRPLHPKRLQACVALGDCKSLKLMWKVCNFVFAIAAYKLCHAQDPKDPFSYERYCAHAESLSTPSVPEFSRRRLETFKFFELRKAMTCSLVDTWSLLRMMLEIRETAFSETWVTTKFYDVPYFKTAVSIFWCLSTFYIESMLRICVIIIIIIIIKNVLATRHAIIVAAFSIRLRTAQRILCSF
jgi:hypothetical protein